MTENFKFGNPDDPQTPPFLKIKTLEKRADALMRDDDKNPTPTGDKKITETFKKIKAITDTEIKNASN